MVYRVSQGMALAGKAPPNVGTEKATSMETACGYGCLK